MSKNKVVPKEEGELAGTTLKIPVEDWVERYAEEEVDLSTLDKAIKLLVERGYAPATMGALCLIGGLRGEVPEEVALFPKSTLLTGVSQVINQRLKARKKEFKAPSGKTFLVREFVAVVPITTRGDGDGSDDDEMALDVETIQPGHSYAETGTQEALDRAEQYLLQRVTGYIFNRLKVIAASGGDVQAIADILKEKIDDMVDRLMGPVGVEPSSL